MLARDGNSFNKSVSDVCPRIVMYKVGVGIVIDRKVPAAELDFVSAFFKAGSEDCVRCLPTLDEQIQPTGLCVLARLGDPLSSE